MNTSHEGPFPPGCPLDGSFWERLGEINTKLGSIAEHLATQNNRLAKGEGLIAGHLHHHELEAARADGRADVFLTKRQIQALAAIVIGLVTFASAGSAVLVRLLETRAVP